MDILFNVGSFILGFFADIARRVLLPATETWIEGWLPNRRRARNQADNLIRLEVRKKLVDLGHDPALANHLHEDAEAFQRRLDQGQRAKIEAFAAIEADRLVSEMVTQADMNAEAFDSFRATNRRLHAAIDQLRAELPLTAAAAEQLDNAQRAWEAFREADAQFEALILVEGGTMQPLVHAVAMEDITVDRIAHLNALREGRRHPQQ